MNRKILRKVALFLVLIMVFTSFTVLADNTDDSNAANNPPILSWIAGEGLWLNFSVNYEKSKVRLSSEFINVNQFDNSNTGKWTQLSSDADGNYKTLINDGEFGNELMEKGIWIVISDKDNAQARYWHIRLGGEEKADISSVELNADGTEKGTNGWRFDDPSMYPKNIQPVKKSSGEEIEKDAKFCYRFVYSDPNVAQDKWALNTDLKARIFYVNKGADPKVLANRTYVTVGNLDSDGFVLLDTDGKYCHIGQIKAGADYYLQYQINKELFVYEVEPGMDYATVFLFTAETKDKWFNGAWSYNVIRDALGNHINPYEFNGSKKSDKDEKPIEDENDKDKDKDTDIDNRIAGKNRFDTAVAIAKAQFPKGLTAKDGYKNVVVAEVKTFADALTAGVVAFEYKAPLLMVQGNELPDDTAKYIKANADRVIIVGGFSTVSNKVADEIRDLGVVVKRISGSNRFGTAVEVGEAFRGLIAATNERPAFNLGYDTKSTVFLANAYTFADALTASVPAAYYGIPILLTHQDKLAPETIEALAKWDIEKVIIVGGEKSVSKAVENELANLGKGYSVERFSGATRQLTSMVLAKTFFEDVTRVFFANGDAFSDALAAAPFGARVKAPIILVEKDKVSDDVVNFLRSNNILEGTIFGGTDQISTAVRDQLANILNLRIEYPGIH